jgi:hypothetical protein
MKKECQTDSLSMIAIIIPNVLSFFQLTIDGSEGEDGYDGEGDGNKDDH